MPVESGVVEHRQPAAVVVVVEGVPVQLATGFGRAGSGTASLSAKAGVRAGADGQGERDEPVVAAASRPSQGSVGAFDAQRGLPAVRGDERQVRPEDVRGEHHVSRPAPPRIGRDPAGVLPARVVPRRTPSTRRAGRTRRSSTRPPLGWAGRVGPMACSAARAWAMSAPMWAEALIAWSPVRTQSINARNVSSACSGSTADRRLRTACGRWSSSSSARRISSPSASRTASRRATRSGCGRRTAFSIFPSRSPLTCTNSPSPASDIPRRCRRARSSAPNIVAADARGSSGRSRRVIVLSLPGLRRDCRDGSLLGFPAVEDEPVGQDVQREQAQQDRWLGPFLDAASTHLTSSQFVCRRS